MKKNKYSIPILAILIFGKLTYTQSKESEKYVEQETFMIEPSSKAETITDKINSILLEIDDLKDRADLIKQKLNELHTDIFDFQEKTNSTEEGKP